MRNPWLVLVLALTVLSCGPGLPEDVRKAAQNLEQRLDQARTQTQDLRKRFEKTRASAAFAPMARYDRAEAWEAAFDRADQTLDRTRSLFDSALAPLIQENNPESAPKVTQEVDRITLGVEEALALARSPFERMERIRAVMTDPDTIYRQATAAGEAVLSRIQTLDDGPVENALEAFPDSAPRIHARFAPMVKLGLDTQDQMTRLEKEYQAGTKADHAVFATAADQLSRSDQEMAGSADILEKELAQLYESYTKVLQDMKTEYLVTVKRESWDENSDFGETRTDTFTRQVSPAVFLALAESPAETIAEILPAMGRTAFRSHVGSAWDGLGINPSENWPDRRHNAAAFWIEEMKEENYHKYLQETNGETKETGWIKVNPSFYEAHLDNLGMAILSKPYGEFEPDPVAAPPGMAYVGNPRYGEWQKDENGESFWSWYGRYAFFSHLFFFPPSHYYYGPWNRWRTDYRFKKPYYEKTSTGQATYGTRGTLIKRSPRFQGTTFAKTGGLKARPASVRGGGASLRGGGPGGQGK